MPQRNSAVRLPLELIGRPEVMQVMREIEALGDVYNQRVVQSRLNTTTIASSLQVSSALQQLGTVNDIELNDQQARESLLGELRAIFDAAPSFHVSFAVEPPKKQLQRVVEWLRQSIHPQVLINTSIIPSITAGCILRTPNKVFDLSLRKSFETASPELLKGIRSL